MAYITNSKVIPATQNVPKKAIVGRLEYEIPQRYRDSFYLANAAFFDSVNWFLHRAYEVAVPSLREDLQKRNANLSEKEAHRKIKNAIEVLDQCNSIIDVRFPVKRENGVWEIVRGFRAQYGQSVGYEKALGGLRIGEGVTRDHMKALAAFSFFRNSCMGLNFSGAHGGIKICPQNYTLKERRTILERYVYELFRKGYSGNSDIVHPDINTGEKEMGLVAETIAKYPGQNESVAAVGKPIELGGIEDFAKLSSLGAYNALYYFINNAEIASKIGLESGLKGKTFIIQGLGKLGAPLAKLLEDSGATCVGVKEFDAYLYDKQGIDVQAVLNHFQTKGSIETFGLAKPLKDDSIYTENCDILVFSACHKSLGCYIAKDVKAKVVLEAADGALTPSSHRILTGKKKLVVPDIYASGGCCVASYLEYVRNLQQSGMFDESTLMYAHPVYEKIVRNVPMERKAVAGNEGAVEAVFPQGAIVKDALEVVFAEVGQEIVNNMERFKLGTDARSGAYVCALKRVFKTMFSVGKYV